MMNMMRQTLVATENYLNDNGKSISDNWVLDNAKFDKDVLMSEIILRGGVFETLYSDPEYYRDTCHYWWLKWKRTFQKWFDAFDIEYDPLENYNRNETITERTVDNGSVNTTTSDNTTATGTNGSTTTVENTQVTNEDGIVKTVTSDREVVDEDGTNNNRTTESGSSETKVSAFDSTAYQPHDKTDTTSDNTQSGSTTLDRTTTKNGSSESSTNNDTTTTNNGKTTTNGNTNNSIDSNGSSDTTTNNIKEFSHTNLTKGNIGVTTSQQMLESELKIQMWNCYNHIADIFLDELCVRVY